MKMNKWTLGLAAVGLVSLTSAVRADESAKTTPLLTALSATTISGYVDTSAVWNPGTGNLSPAPYRFNAGKQDGFNLDSVDLKIAKPLEEGQWSSGYVAELMFGPDASLVNNGDSFSGISSGTGISSMVRQAYVSLRMPVGNGIDWKVGRFDCPLGYESTDSYKDPNWTRSYGYTFEPTEQTGVMAEYKVNDMIALSAGVANTVTTTPFINDRSNRAESKKAVMGMINLTAPESWGVLGGSGLYAGIDYGPGANSFDGVDGEDRTHVYVGATIKTGIQGLTLGAAWDSVNHMDVDDVDTGYAMSAAVYASFKLTDKASIHLRGEYAKGAALGALADLYNGTSETDFTGAGFGGNPLRKVIAVTGTFQYDLWQNVISRIEVRWDHQADGNADAFGGKSFAQTEFEGAGPAFDSIEGTKRNEITVAANLVYKF